MRTTVEAVEPFILESRETIKLVVGHLMAVKGGETGRLREALHEARALTDQSRRVNFMKVAQLSMNMECLIEAAEQEGSEQLHDTLEVLCDICAHIVLYLDTVLLYADTVAMVIEYPWMRDALTRRLRDFVPEGFLKYEEAEMPTPDGAGGSVSPLYVARDQNPSDTLNELQMLFESRHQDSDLVVDVSRVQELPLWLLGTLMSYHVALQRQGRQVRLTGIRQDRDANFTMQRLSERFREAC